MLIDLTNITSDATRHREALIADAENYRLAERARAARRAARAETQRRGLPRPLAERPPLGDHRRQNPAQRKDDANRRYAVPR